MPVTGLAPVRAMNPAHLPGALLCVFARILENRCPRCSFRAHTGTPPHTDHTSRTGQ